MLACHSMISRRWTEIRSTGGRADCSVDAVAGCVGLLFGERWVKQCQWRRDSRELRAIHHYNRRAGDGAHAPKNKVDESGNKDGESGSSGSSGTSSGSNRSLVVGGKTAEE